MTLNQYEKKKSASPLVPLVWLKKAWEWVGFKGKEVWVWGGMN